MASIFQSLPLLKKAAPRLWRQFFTCRACSHQRSVVPKHAPRSFKATRQTPFLQAFKSPTKRLLHNASSSNKGSPLSELSRALNRNASDEKESFFPAVTSKSVAYWLLGSAASVFGIVVWGGLTRLTESGLSITEWRPVTGSLPPRNSEDWEAEFSKYRSSPEFQRLNPYMTLEEFKQIYWMEWSHRLWGRVIGVTAVVPTILFIATRRVSRSMALKLTGICGLIGFQGFIGWWMVKSGLHDDLFAPGSHPRVSQYRLTAHLGAAFIVYTTMLVSALNILKEHTLLRDPDAARKYMKLLQEPKYQPFRRSTAALTALIFITAMSGALVAGLDAGLIYNEFPYMGVGLTPPKKELFDPWYSRKADQSDLWWRNMLENPSLVQLNHRILATTTFTAIMVLFAYTRLSSRLRPLVTRDVKKSVTGVVHLVLLQVTLGISTLLYLVPTWLAATHQAGSLALLTGALLLNNKNWIPRRTVLLLKQMQSMATNKSINRTSKLRSESHSLRNSHVH
ncbi:cytochrome c oxidase assembly protein-like protein cox15 [Patellaria atrata CBS 101060]|uniref:Cytochrome c oxidase assembly protein-like protein cox15 n=1 Tax=Patellaria atrata CBS 101060 TaxID=1346257 RepID=A0A9P4S7D1_9PEZI|nr:cytochrome c oxidase assembly protein-like protein cox15 [Patellaria atrata CBS 101060]